MPTSGQKKSFVLRVTNLRSIGCVRLLQDQLVSEGFDEVDVQPGLISLPLRLSEEAYSHFLKLLSKYGFVPIRDKEMILVEQIKLAVHELIYEMNNVDSVVRKSEYLVEKLNKSYSTLSRVFSLHSDVTLEKYIILHKIERIRELIDEGELSLSEIAFMMDYSSVQYLSSQFKGITGFSVSEYKHSPESIEPFLAELMKVK